MTEDDRLRVSDLVSANYRKLTVIEGYSQQEIDSLIALRGSLEAIQAQSQKYTFWVAVVGDDIVGAAATQKNELTKLYVDPEYVRQGIGMVLFKWVENILRQEGHKEIFLGAFPESVSFYEKMGLIVTGRKEMSAGPLKGRQFVYMSKRL